MALLEVYSIAMSIFFFVDIIRCPDRDVPYLRTYSVKFLYSSNPYH
jgi:hypothetical protein